MIWISYEFSMICVSHQTNFKSWNIHNFVFDRMETLNLKRFHGIAKASGVLFSIAGVIVLAFYQGPAFRSFIHHNPFHHTSNFHAGVTAHPKRVWIFGIFLTTLSTTAWALWTVLQVRMCPGASFIYMFSGHSRCRSNVSLCLLMIFTYTVIVPQGPMLEAYPSKLLNTTLQMIFATIQCFFIALVAERDFSKWKLALGIRLFAVMYSVSSISLQIVLQVYIYIFLIATDE
jgi:hypothetical protein